MPFRLILITTIKAISRKLPNKETLKNNTINIKVNDKLNIDSLRLNLYDLGYVIEREVSEVGTCAVRGSIIDIYSILYNNPIRIELFDDEVESIRFFNIEDGKSYKNVEEITIYPVREAIYKDSIIEDIVNKDIDSELKDNIQKSKYFFMKASFQHQYLFFCARTTCNADFLVSMRLRDTPVPIPNTMVKT